MRREQHVTCPDCPCQAAKWAIYNAAQRARRHGYCDACWSALCASREPWPAEVWAALDAQAAAGNKGAHMLPFPKLPPAPKARRESAAKYEARLREAWRKDADQQCQAVIGRPTGDGYQIAVTNGHCALLVPGAGTQDAALSFSYGKVRTPDRFIDLPAGFHLALKRVALCANERSPRITLTVAGRIVTISTVSVESSASESVDGLLSQVDLTATTWLDARYLLDACGIWPLRWYPAGAEEPQIFEVGGGAYRAVIMPMWQ